MLNPATKQQDDAIRIYLREHNYAVLNIPASHLNYPEEKTRWRFIVVSDDLDEHAMRKARQRDKAPGLVFDDAELNIQVWAYEWTEIIANAKARLQFINASLSYEANRASSKAYLQKAHAKFIPKAGAVEADEPEEETDEPEVPQ